MIERMGWITLGVSSSEMSWLIVSQLGVAFATPILGLVLYYSRISRAIDRMPAGSLHEENADAAIRRLPARVNRSQKRAA